MIFFNSREPTFALVLPLQLTTDNRYIGRSPNVEFRGIPLYIQDDNLDVLANDHPLLRSSA